MSTNAIIQNQSILDDEVALEELIELNEQTKAEINAEYDGLFNEFAELGVWDDEGFTALDDSLDGLNIVSEHEYDEDEEFTPEELAWLNTMMSDDGNDDLREMEGWVREDYQTTPIAADPKTTDRFEQAKVPARDRDVIKELVEQKQAYGLLKFTAANRPTTVDAGRAVAQILDFEPSLALGDDLRIVEGVVTGQLDAEVLGEIIDEIENDTREIEGVTFETATTKHRGYAERWIAKAETQPDWVVKFGKPNEVTKRVKLLKEKATLIFLKDIADYKVRANLTGRDDLTRFVDEHAPTLSGGIVNDVCEADPGVSHNLATMIESRDQQVRELDTRVGSRQQQKKKRHGNRRRRNNRR